MQIPMEGVWRERERENGVCNVVIELNYDPEFWTESFVVFVVSIIPLLYPDS